MKLERNKEIKKKDNEDKFVAATLFILGVIVLALVMALIIWIMN